MKKSTQRKTRRSGAMENPAADGAEPKSGSPTAEAPLSERQSPRAVVGVGASAGGLAALESFLRGMPDNLGAAFVVVTHQHPGHTSLLPELLRKHTRMELREVADGLQLKPNVVYLSTPGNKIGLEDGRLRVQPYSAEGSVRLPIDHFFRSLAHDQKERAVGVVLSGTGSDGTLGLRAIKGGAGLAMAQSSESAEYSGMPQSAVATGLVDVVALPEAMAEPLLSFVAGLARLRTDMREAEGELPALREFQALLHSRAGHDFSAYKPSTIQRRIARRMNLQQIEDPSDYVHFLKTQPQELDLLCKDLLIGVTGFFRDPAAFEILTREHLMPALRKLPENAPVRVWAPGCSTGEEPYSLAIVLHECAEALQRRFNVQVFGTDLDQTAIEFARTGVYSEGIAVDVSRARLKRYFNREDDHYRIKKEIREMLVFAPQNALKDPPFTKLNLVSCRNLLIYLNADSQRRLLALFHYALKRDGLLFLGPSETVGSLSESLFCIDKRWKIYRRMPPAPAVPEVTVFPFSTGKGPGGAGGSLSHRDGRAPAIGTLERALLARHVPPSVVTNERGDIVHIHGRTGQFLEPATGQPRLNILEMAREGLRTELTAAMRHVVVHPEAVINREVQVRTNGGFNTVKLVVSRLEEPESVRGLLLISFQSQPKADRRDGARSKARLSRGGQNRVAELERELHYTRENLQSTVEELEASNEELKSTNEEMQSTNEELQSTNEELETSKEEMQSLNEELQSVNAQLQSKLEELSESNDDMQNLLNSTEIATIFLDLDLRIRRFTAEARQVINLIPGDVGRPIGDLTAKLDYDELAQDVSEVLRTLVYREREVRTRNGDWRLMRVLPYRTVDNVIDGLVLTFLDINKIKEAELAAESASNIAQSVIGTMRESLLVLDEQYRVVRVNPMFCRTFSLDAEEIKGVEFFRLCNGLWDVPRLRAALAQIEANTDVIRDYMLEHDFKEYGVRTIVLNARRLVQAQEEPPRLLLVMEDVTEWKNRHESQK